MKKVILLRNSQNIIHTLRDRESGFTGRLHNAHYSTLPKLSYERRFYENIMPTLTVQNVESPNLFMRKFTPDGKMLLTISSNQRSLVVLSYQGVGAVADLLADETRECIASMDSDSNALEIRSSLFSRLFQRKLTIHLAVDEYSRFLVHREFSIFFDDGRYVMLAASGINDTAPDIMHFWNYPDLYDDLELFTYVFFIIDLQTGKITDILKFPHDNINLSHNHGVAVYGRTIAILSKFRQSVALFELHEGQLTEHHIKGAFTMRHEVINAEITVDSVPPLALIKQRILAYMIRKIINSEKSAFQRSYQLEKFYRKFETYEDMLIEKIQLIDQENVLIRYEKKPTEDIIQPSPPRIFCWDFKLYVFYSLSMDKILHVCERHSMNLLFMLRDYCDQFRNVRSLFTGWVPSSPCNSEPFRSSFNHAIRTFVAGPREAAARFNQTIPVSTQSYSTSPYLSYSLFAYDDRLISALERPKLSSNFPIRFCHRETQEVKFRLHLEHRSSSSTRELVAFIFHPYEPFFISIQKLQNGYFINFHIYNRSTIVVKELNKETRST